MFSDATVPAGSSDDERLRISAERQSSIDLAARRRSTRACDHCRRSKSKCEREPYASDTQPCRGCVSLGFICTYVGPSRKRGPPKGYILAIERRLHQVEALLGTIIGSDDPRARSLVHDLSQDELACQIIRRVDIGPFGSRGRVAHPFGSTKEDFLASIMTGVENSNRTGDRSHEADALVSPRSSWQDTLHHVLHTSASRPSLGFVIAERSPPPSTSSLSQAPLTSVGYSDSAQLGWSVAEFNTVTSSEDHNSSVLLGIQDIYIDGDGRPRVVHATSGLHVLSQYNRLDGKPLAIPWSSATTIPLLRPTGALSLFQPPTAQQQHILVHYFFNRIHPMYPVINRTYFMALYNENSVVKGPYHIHDRTRMAFETLLLCMFAISARYLDVPGGNRDGDEYATETVRSLHSFSGFSHPLLCQILLLLAYRSVGIGAAEDAWTYIGMAVRMAQSLGLHRRTDELASPDLGLISLVEQQARPQIWSGCIIADRFVSVLLGRPPMIHDGQFDAPVIDVREGDHGSLPDSLLSGILSHQSEEANDTVALSCLSASCTLSVIVGSILHELYPIARPTSSMLYFRAKQLEDRLSGWVQSTSSSMAFSPANIDMRSPPCVLELQLQYWWTVILLHRVFIAVKGSHFRPGDQQSQALAACQDAAGHISSIVSVLVKQWVKYASPYLSGYILLVGAIDVLHAKLSPNAAEAATRLRRNITALREIEVKWPMASVVQKLLYACASNFPATSFMLSSPKTNARKRSTGEAFQDAERRGEHEAKRSSPQRSVIAAMTKDMCYDGLGRVHGLQSGLDFIASPPYPGFQDRDEGPSSVSSLSGVGYGSSTVPSLTSFGLW